MSQTPAASNLQRNLAYVEESVAEDDILVAARERAVELGASPVPPAVGALLSMYAQLLGAKAVVEVGTGAGISGLWLLDGMHSEGTLTTIDSEPEHQRAAREAFRAADIAPARTRLINGRALDVLPRLADGAYDLVFIDCAPLEHPQYVEQGVRLLREGGAILLHNALLGGRVPDPAQRDPATQAVRAATRAVAEDPQLTSVLIPVGDGLLCASRG
ncbi:O-methyltransferase [Nocardia otitidiscaviarum]|uniref:O-methyltransferase n=1 Tax=Nocardia otitidiscaviarum TaxID=1823 RepID=A0A378Y9R4_9NOCA|nr:MULTISPECIES: O-methyltransferase [Nocardia]MBF6131791.1 O-methyltransferase [Nocardia otitidiscaviarum]MBF6178143.1 O-methyltransferase [Nocardia otitidiscaviarum]MBF6238449.1 O-methyltransferase [Nocardia otitidiscaviarum]MBF6482922.1 O-methyltransferase [Nocardia otitidiscaviarum]MCP9623221.1 O-methyltransferase [Nocardia otitidiscaviarum]